MAEEKKTTLEEAALLFASPMGRKDPEHIDEYPYSRADKLAFIAGAEWQKQQTKQIGMVTIAEEDFDAEKEKSAEWGYNLCKQQMMKEAFHTKMRYDDHGDLVPTLPDMSYKFQWCEKVIAIIFKSDESV